MKKTKNSGITLVALVITIIILLILAGISIATLTGSGLFENARLAEQKSKNAQELEDTTLKDYENKIDDYLNVDRNVKVQYNANGGSGNMQTAVVKKYDKYILPDSNFTRNQHSFLGWCLDKDGTGEIYSKQSEVEITNNVTFYAIWKREKALIKFDANDGIGTMNDIEIELNQSIQLPVNTFTKEGYEFEKWTTNKDGSGTSYEDSDFVTTDSEIILYAQWAMLPKEYYLSGHDLCSTITGGWDIIQSGSVYSKSWQESTNNSKDTYYLSLSKTGASAGNARVMVVTKNKINLKDINAIKYKCAYRHDGKESNIYVGISDNNEIDTNFLVGNTISIPSTQLTEDTITIDTTDYNDSYYIKFILERGAGGWYTALTHIYNIFGV